MKPEPKARIHFKKNILDEKIADLSEEIEMWSDEEMERAFGLAIDFGVIEDLIQNSGDLQRKFYAEFEEERKIGRAHV